MKIALHLAAGKRETGLEEVKQLLAANPASLNEPHPISKYRPICYAAHRGSLATLRYLIEVANADVTALEKDEQGNTINLLYFARNNTPDVMAYLTDPANHIVERFHDGSFNIHNAARYGLVDRFFQLINTDPAQLFLKDRSGHTALYWASYCDRPSLTHFYITHPDFIADPQPNKLDHMLRGTANRLSKNAFQQAHQEKIQPALTGFKEARQCYEQLTLKTSRDFENLIKCICYIAELLRAQEKLDEAIAEFNLAFSMVAHVTHQSESLTDTLSKSKMALEEAQSLRSTRHFIFQWGYKTVDMPHDGDCFFHAVADQLKFHPTLSIAKLTPQQLRTLTVKHMREQKAEYLPFYIDNDFDAYLSRLNKKGTWADQFCILAFSRAFNVNIVQLVTGGQPPLFYKPAQPQATLHILFEQPNHYQSLHIIEGITPEKNIMELLAIEPTDEFVAQPVELNSDSMVTSEITRQQHYVTAPPSIFSRPRVPPKPFTGPDDEFPERRIRRTSSF